jgi:hypothetical protein
MRCYVDGDERRMGVVEEGVRIEGVVVGGCEEVGGDGAVNGVIYESMVVWWLCVNCK